MTLTTRPRPMSEADLSRAVLDMARLFGWRVAHFRPALTSKGWRTPVEADGAGFPDLLMLRKERLLAVELKSARGYVSLEQSQWLADFEAAGCDAVVWRPAQLDDGTIERVLR